MRCLRARVGRLRFVRAGRPLLPRVPALTHLACPRALAWALLCLRGGGSLGLLWACLLAGGWVSCLRAGRVRLGVCVLACVRSLGGGGAVWSRRPLAPACLLACVLTPWCGLVGVCAVLRARWADGGQVGAGQSCPAPLRALVALSTARCVARKERRVGGEGALMVC